MSEYQYYEFQALDRPLTNADQSFIQGLSSRVELTATNARFVYNYGDFSSNPKRVLDRCFDLMLYVTNFGVRQLMIRFPKTLVNPESWTPYCIPYLLSVETTKQSFILNIHLTAEDYYGWVDGEGWLAGLVALREELLRGDLRVLYLAWLQAGFSDDIDPDFELLIEPPVPPNLQKLSPALATFVELFHVNQDLIDVAAESSQVTQPSLEPVEEWIAALPESECNQYLLRVAKGESHVGAELMQHLRESFSRPEVSVGQPSNRSRAELIELADSKRKERQHQSQLAAAKARRQKLKALAPQADALWQEIFQLIELKQSKPYDQALRHLRDLRDLAEFQGTLEAFRERIVQMKQQYSRRPGLLSRLRKANLLR